MLNTSLVRFGAALKARREEVGLSQQALERASGVSERTIARYEQGESLRHGELLCVLSALGFTLQPLPAEAAPRALNAEIARVASRLDEGLDVVETILDRLSAGIARIEQRLDDEDAQARRA